MKLTAITVSILLCSTPLALAQGAGSSAGSTAGSGGAAAGGTGSTLSNGSTINGTGGSPGANTSSALSHGTTGNNLGAAQADPSPASTSGNAVNTPTANRAVQSLGNTDTGILRK